MPPNRHQALQQKAPAKGPFTRVGYVYCNGHFAGLLSEFGDRVGLAFQVMDDVLDVTQSTERLGKPAGSDEALDKNTFPKLMGTEQAVDMAHTLIDEALALLQQTRLQTATLQALAQLVTNRDH